MNAREIQIAKAVLKFLHDDGGQRTEIFIHAAINNPQGTDIGASASELAAVLATCDASRWITGVKSMLSGQMKWSINDAGAAVLMEITS